MICIENFESLKIILFDFAKKYDLEDIIEFASYQKKN